MASHTVPIGALTVKIDVDHGVETATATGRVLDADAQIVAEFPPQRFSGYCENEIVSNVIWTMLFGRRINGIFYDAPDLDAAIAAISNPEEKSENTHEN